MKVKGLGVHHDNCLHHHRVNQRTGTSAVSMAAAAATAVVSVVTSVVLDTITMTTVTPMTMNLPVNNYQASINTYVQATAYVQCSYIFCQM